MTNGIYQGAVWSGRQKGKGLRMPRKRKEKEISLAPSDALLVPTIPGHCRILVYSHQIF